MIKQILKTRDLWEYLSLSKKKILLYGMGDGADKVIDVCNSKNIEINGVFASDGFSKNKIFRGFEVTDYSTAKERFGSFIVLMSFATSRDEVIENVHRIAQENELYCPDVPVFGDGLFDIKYINDNFSKLEEVYSLLSDEKSKKNFINLICGRVSGNIDYLKEAETTVSESYANIIQPSNDTHYVDIGAYNGDTIREYLSFAKQCKKITAFEPDFKNFNKLINFATENEIDTSNFHNIAAWDKSEELTFYSRSGRNSAGTTSHKNVKCTVIRADAADNYIDSRVDHINIDAEGSDRNVLYGLKKTIELYHPTLSCALYHRTEDYFDIPLLLKDLYGNCEMYIRHFKYYPAWDTNVYVRPFQN